LINGKLCDRQAALAVVNRITRAAVGNFGDVQTVGAACLKCVFLLARAIVSIL